jgi:hypothetical protein
MQLDLTKEQYACLLKIIYFGNSIIISLLEGNNEAEDFIALEEYIYAKADDFELGEYIDFDEESNTFVPSKKLDWDKKMNKYKSEYDEFIFWEELITRFARRDFVKKYGENNINKMDLEEAFKKEAAYLEKYEKEFKKHGIKRLYIKSR